MQVFTAADDVRKYVHHARCNHQRVGFVPTMGYLHAGHRALLREARSQNDIVAVSIYVNPTQFGPSEDFGRYPRDIVRDESICIAEEVDMLFIPNEAEMYPHGPEGQTLWVHPGQLGEQLCGSKRPGHFRGVATVVAKLFNIVTPDRAYLGGKDAQQAIIISRMVEDLALPIVIHTVSTVREDDGLALSSRNAYLSPDERMQARALHSALDAACRALHRGSRDTSAIQTRMLEVLSQDAPDGVVDYAQVVDLRTLQPVHLIVNDVLIAVAVYFGATRLIDNVRVQLGTDGPLFS